MDLLQQLRSTDESSLSGDDARVEVLRAAQELCQRLETPFEWVQRMTWQEVSKIANTRPLACEKYSSSEAP